MENNAEMKKLPYVAAKIDRLMDNSGSLKGFATITIANSFMVHNIKVMEGSKGLFVAMPSRSFTNGQGETKYSDICHSINADMKQRIDDVVLKAYEQAIGQSQSAPSDEYFHNPEPLDQEDVPTDESFDSPADEASDDEGFGYDFVPTM